MISPIEKRALLLYASKSQAPIVEFGAFLGASSYALAAGSKLNRHLSKVSPSLYVLDSFSSELSHPFAKHVLAYASRYSLEQFLEFSGDSVSWLPVVEDGLKPFSSKVRLMRLIVNDQLKKISGLPSEIGLLHLDLPKDILTLRPIAVNCFPRLKAGSVLAFQDYYYHYSGELIAFFEYLEKAGLVIAEKSVDTTVYYRVVSSLSCDVVEQFIASCDVMDLLHNAVERTLKSGISNVSKVAVVLAYVHALTSHSLEPSGDFALQSKVRELIYVAFSLDAKSTSLRLSELMTEDLVRL